MVVSSDAIWQADSCSNDRERIEVGARDAVSDVSVEAVLASFVAVSAHVIGIIVS